MGLRSRWEITCRSGICKHVVTKKGAGHSETPKWQWTVLLLCTDAPNPSTPDVGEKQCGLHRVMICVILVLFTHIATQDQKEERVEEYQHGDEQMRASRHIQHEMFCIKIRNISIWCFYINFYVHSILIQSIPMFLHIECRYCHDLVKNGAARLSNPFGEMEHKSIQPHTG